MPHSSLKIIPGVDTNKTPALNEAAISTTSFVRFIPDRTLGGLVQKLGGWTKFFPNQIGSTIRALWAWQDINSNSWLGVGATQSLSAIVDGGAKTITPQTTTASTSIAVTGASWSSGVATLTFSTSFPFQPGATVVVSGVSPSGYDGTYVLTAGGSGSISYAKTPDPGSYVSGGSISSSQGVPVSFSTTAGSSTVIVDDTGSALDAFDVVDIKTQVSVGGLILFGLYRVTPISANQYSIQARDVLGNPAYATSTATPGAVASFEFTSGSAVVRVTLNNHGLQVGDTFPVLIPVVAGGVTIEGNYLVQSLDSGSPANIFTIQAANSATTTPTLTASGTGSVATLTFASTYTVPVGSTIVVAGVTPAGYNGTYTVTRSSAGSVSYANATTGAQTVAGTIFVSVVRENNNLAGLVYFNGTGPLAVNSGYGVGGYGTGGYGSGVPPVSGGGTPITNTIDWSLDNWGETLIASPLDGPIYEWTPSANNPTATIIPEAPQINEGVFVAMPQQQIIAYGSTFNGVKDALLIRWCDVANYNSWIGLVTNQAGSYRIPKGSRIIQGIQGPQQGLIWTDLAIWAMQYVGPPYVYQFNELGTGCGLIGRKAAASVNGVVYWMGQSQFFRLAEIGNIGQAHYRPSSFHSCFRCG